MRLLHLFLKTRLLLPGALELQLQPCNLALQVDGPLLGCRYYLRPRLGFQFLNLAVELSILVPQAADYPTSVLNAVHERRVVVQVLHKEMIWHKQRRPNKGREGKNIYTQTRDLAAFSINTSEGEPYSCLAMSGIRAPRS